MNILFALLFAVHYYGHALPNGTVGRVTPSDVITSTNATFEAKADYPTLFCYWESPNASVKFSPNKNAATVKVSGGSGSVDVNGYFSSYREPQEQEPSDYRGIVQITTAAQPDTGGKTSPEQRTFWGFNPMTCNYTLSCSNYAGYAFNRWVLNGVTKSRQQSFSDSEVIPRDSATIATTKKHYIAVFDPLPITVTVVADGQVVGTKTAHYGDDFCGPFTIVRDIPVNHHFRSWTGTDTIGHNYVYGDSRVTFSVNLSGYIPPYPSGSVTCTMESEIVPNYPWRDDPSGGSGDAGTTPNINNPLGWVWVHARPIPSDGSKGTCSPTDWAIHGNYGETKTFNFMAIPADSQKQFIHWEDSSGNVLSRDANYSPSYPILNDNDGQGYEVYIYARFSDKPPEKKKCVVLYTPYMLDANLNFHGGLGTIYCEDSESTNTSQGRGGQISKIAYCEYTDLEEEPYYAFVEDPVTLPYVSASPADGFEIVSWWRRDRYHSDTDDQYMVWRKVADGDAGLTQTIPAITIAEKGSSESTPDASTRILVEIACVFKPKFGLRNNTTGMNNWNITLTPNVEYQQITYPDGANVDLAATATRTSGDGLLAYASLTLYEYGGDVLGSKSTNYYNSCNGPSKDMEVNLLFEKPSNTLLPDGYYDEPWGYSFDFMFHQMGNNGKIYCDGDGNVIYKNANGEIEANYMD